MSTELALAEKYDRLKQVVDLKMEGHNPTEISRMLGMKRYEVLEDLDEYKRIISHDHTLLARARESVYTLDEHTNKLIRKAYEVVEATDSEMDMNGVDPKLLAQKLGALKAVSDFEQKRFATLKEFGLLDDMEVANQVAETERKMEILMGILREVTNDCNRCRIQVTERLQRVTGEVEVVQVVVQE